MLPWLVENASGHGPGAQRPVRQGWVQHRGWRRGSRSPLVDLVRCGAAVHSALDPAMHVAATRSQHALAATAGTNFSGTPQPIQNPCMRVSHPT